MPTDRTWRDRFVDARFSEDEQTEWERLVLVKGWRYDAATTEMLRRREEAQSK
jgi:hypothetical protein